MTQEEKRLLLKVLCEMLPYGVKIQRDNVFDADAKVVEALDISLMADDIKYDVIDGLHIKPYLRPMSSMTEEEIEEFNLFQCLRTHYQLTASFCNIDNEANMFDWLNEHHFDYRGLIENGLALEAPEGMYKKEESK